MKNRRDTIRKMVNRLNNTEEDGGYWLPNIQRPFVWSDKQIFRLYDSIMREYPISTFLVWKTTSPLRRRKFIDNWTEGMKLSEYFVPEDNHRKVLVLDGQQRLQSLFIGLRGSYNGKELHVDILSGDLVQPEDIRYKFSFIDASKAQFPWVKFKDLVYSEKNSRQLEKSLEERAANLSYILSSGDLDRLADNIGKIDKAFKIEETITYQELDSIDSPELYQEDDVVEIFIRANSGGTFLGKSDLLFSLLSASWEMADKAMNELLDDINHREYAFTQDFVLKTCLSLLDQGARYEVAKFRKAEVKKQIEEEWVKIANSIRGIHDFLYGNTFIRCDKAIPSYLALIPLVYLRYHFPDAWKNAKEMDTYILRTLISGAFNFAPDQLIDLCVRKIKELQSFNSTEMSNLIKSTGRSLQISEERLFDMGYDSPNIYLLFSLWYKDFNFTPSYLRNSPQIDHIFPRSQLRQIKVDSSENVSGKQIKYRKADQNQLANCMLLTAEENGAGGKSSTIPSSWFCTKSKEYLEMHLIPDNPELWNIERFDDFIEARKTLIRAKFSYLLVGNDND